MDREEAIKTRVEFLTSARCNHTQHMYIDITDDLIQGTLLARIIYWFAESKDHKSKVRIYKDGFFWIAKQRKDWWEEIRITERQYDKAIKGLEEKGFVVLAKYKFDSMPTIHIRPNSEVINKATEKWKAKLREEVIADYEEELKKEENGNDIKCKSLGNNTKCNSGITQNETLLTMITNNDYSNKDYNTEITKGDTLSKDNAKADTMTSKKSLPDVTPKKNWFELKELEQDMINRFCKVAQQYDITDVALNNIINAFKRYLYKYTEKTGKIHPILKDETLEKVFIALATIDDEEYSHYSDVAEYEVDENGISYLDELVDEHFKSEHRCDTDYHISHFANSNYLSMISQHIVEY